MSFSWAIFVRNKDFIDKFFSSYSYSTNIAGRYIPYLFIFAIDYFYKLWRPSLFGYFMDKPIAKGRFGVYHGKLIYLVLLKVTVEHRKT